MSEWLPGMDAEMVAERDRRIAQHERWQEEYEPPSHVRGAGDYTNAVKPAIHTATREVARNALGDTARKSGIRLHVAAVARLADAAVDAAFREEAEQDGTVCETCGRVTVEPVVDSNEGFAFCGQCAVELVGAERDLLRNTLAGLLVFARGNHPVLDRIHAALDDTTEPRTKTREEG